MRVNDLGDKLRAQGLTVVETAGCWTRGWDFPDRPPGKIRHWTAGPILGETPCLKVCTHGRTGLPGPLCNVYQSRRVDGNGLDVVYLVATGKANHAGTGIWNGHEGNYEFLGLEIEWAGPTEPFVGVRRREETSLRVMRALHAASSGRAADACEHREYATPRGRKQDTNLDGNALRRDIATPPPPPGDDFLMALSHQEQVDLKNQVGELYLHLVGPDVPQWGDDNPRHNSVVTRLRYLFGESLGGDNLGEFRALLDNAVGNAQGIDDLLAKVEALETEIVALRDAQAPPT